MGGNEGVKKKVEREKREKQEGLCCFGIFYAT
jgi:hypothetical protein